MPVLDELARDDRFEICGCATQPDQAKGRKRTLTATAVGEWCAANNIEADKPDDVNETNFLSYLGKLCPQIILVFAFGQILRKELLDLPELGCINIHGSLLPKYRGASPVNAAILNGDKLTGISIMKMDEGLDEGPVYKKLTIEMTGRETYMSLSKQLADFSADHIAGALLDIVSGETRAVEQGSEGLSIVKKIKKENAVIDWNQPAVKIERMVRAYYPWPGAWFQLEQNSKLRKMIITEADVNSTHSNQCPGQIVQADNEAWVVSCSDTNLEIKKCIPEGKKEMTGRDFIRGCKLELGSFIYEKNNRECRASANENCLS
ncbi:MAG: methionyl-tRNA formyltransferase [Lentisphaeria bacterium]|nr:methionyl-tRNA formyltransferase [Lentisphaeria bacterium]